MAQEKKEVIKEIIEKDIWGSIESFLNLGFHYTEGDKSIHIISEMDSPVFHKKNGNGR